MKKIKVLLNAIKTRNNYFNKKIDLDNKPSLIWIEPTNLCNLKCVMCPNYLIPIKKKGLMDFSLFCKIINEIKDYCASIYLLVGGESLIHPRLSDMVKYARDNNVRVLLNTNATLLTKELSYNLLNSGISHVTFAIDGYNKANYERIRRGAKWDIVIENIKNFMICRDNSKNKPFVAITTIILGNEDFIDKDKEEFYKIFDGLEIDEFIEKRPNSWGNKFKGTDKFNPIGKESDFNHCGHLWSTATILWNGDIVPCCFDFQAEYKLGNITENTLLEIWNNNKMKTLRAAMLNNTYLDHNKLCDGCAILWTKKSLGLPAGLRAAVTDSLTNLTGFWLEKELIILSGKMDDKAVLRGGNNGI